MKNGKKRGNPKINPKPADYQKSSVEKLRKQPVSYRNRLFYGKGHTS
jgi:hypothetical protein